MLESSPLEDIFELHRETKDTRSLSCCSSAAERISQTMVHNIQVAFNLIQDADTRID
ncbi:hypothetical protein ACJMK2_039437, partial [Sinanodonta woodiana]